MENSRKKSELRLDLSGKKLTAALLTTETPGLVRVLILDSCDLLKLPEEIQVFSNLEHISIKYNKNIDMEQVIYILKSFEKLKFIDLSHNSLINIPHSFTELTSITGIRFSYNQLDIENVSLVLKQMPRLSRLWIDNNNLEYFPSDFFTFPKLRFLYAFDNKIQKLSLPEEQSRKLWVLHLGNNKFTNLPLALIHVKKLRMVMLNKNPIEYIPEEFATQKYSFNALILDENNLALEEKKKADKMFKKFMMFSCN